MKLKKINNKNRIMRNFGLKSDEKINEIIFRGFGAGFRLIIITI